MTASMSGSLIARRFAEERLGAIFAGRTGEALLDQALRDLRRWWMERVTSIGPVSSVRRIFDTVAHPLVTRLGFEVVDAGATPSGNWAAALHAGRGSAVGLLVLPSGGELQSQRREAIRNAIRAGARWSLCFNVARLRLVDAARAYSSAYLEFDVESTLKSPADFAPFWTLTRADAFARVNPDGTSLVEDAVKHSDRYTSAVCRSLRHGVLEALTELLRAGVTPRRGGGVDASADHLHEAFEQCLTLVYRVLFLLFAEARGLLPLWHPIFRRSYSIESLRDMLDDPCRPPGLRDALAAISRMAHRGCRAGTLRVTPFNGRLFAPERTPIAERGHLDDEVIRGTLRALCTQPAGRSGRERIAYDDLGVEQLGAVYETLLDYEPTIDRAAEVNISRPARPAVRLIPGGDRRKATGSFYTPRSITEFLVRRSLSPLVCNQSADAILGLKIVDPAMGSGAFLVAACRYLAAGYESALIAEGNAMPADISDDDRAGFRRLVAQRCLYGVDLNPMAVQLVRLSMWLATLAADRPLTFLDHHLATGDSLVGASLEDIARQPPPGASRAARRPQPLPLFDLARFELAVRDAMPIRDRLARQPDDTPAIVRDKERTLARLSGVSSDLSRWKALADLWCACWFWPQRDSAPGAGVFAELADAVIHGETALPERTRSGLLATVREISARRRFFHWTLEFPEVFFHDDGRHVANGGFDAVLGNPPWDMVRADGTDRAAAGPELVRLSHYLRTSGVYPAGLDGQINRYQLFVERSIALLKSGGRLGLVVPWGLAVDRGCRSLRRTLLTRCDTDTIVGFDNRTGLFPIHRSVRFALLLSTKGRPTARLKCRLGEQDPARLDSLPDAAADDPPEAFPITLSAPLIERLSGEDLTIPEFKSHLDLVIHERAATCFYPLGSPDGWAARFGRELNATEDRRHFVSSGRGLRIVQGRHIEPFHVRLDECQLRIDETAAGRLIDPNRSFRSARLAYRDVASATNRLTLIAAILPPGTITTHTLFCLKTLLDARRQSFLCGIFNSYVANYLIRARVSSHVTVAFVERLPVPRPDVESRTFGEIVDLVDRLRDARGDDAEAHARMQGLIARLYRLSDAEFRHVLGTFPLVEIAERDRALEQFRQSASF